MNTVAHGGAAEMLALRLMEAGKAPRRFEHRAAGGPSAVSGSQKFYRKRCGINGESVLAALGIAT